MKKILLATLFLVVFVVGCAKQEPVPAKKSVQGLMKHYPSNVKSVQAWRGHNFIVGDTPVIPTDSVPEAELKKYIGKPVIVTGVWHGGEQWQPSKKEEEFPVPSKSSNQIIIRGDGLEVSSIKPIDK